MVIELLCSFVVLFVVSGLWDSFLCGLWGLGLMVFFSGVVVFSNLGVEVVVEVLWSSGLSSWLVIVSLWVGGLCYLCSGYCKVSSRSMFSLCVVALTLSCVLLFIVSGWFLFYFFFEASLVPILFLILGWGYQPERLQAAFYMMMYTVCVSLPMLLVLVVLCEGVGSSSFFFKVSWVGWWEKSVVVSLSLLGVFLVKSPVFMFHLWLPKAHVEAPVAGSMILAGVLLKFGGYGFIMVFRWFFLSFMEFFCLLISFVMWGGLVAGLICLRQADMKSLIAYSSVGHMSLCLAGIISCFGVGWWGGLLMMVAHGLCSPGLFSLAAYTYELFGSRIMYLCSGVLSAVPVLSLCWFLMCSSNMAFPPSLSLLSEIMLMVSLGGVSLWVLVPTGLMAFVVGVYSLCLYAYIQHGSESSVSVAGEVLSFDYMLLSFLLWVPLNMLVLCSDFMVGWL